MSSRFVSKLRREVKTNPKKAGALALLLVVAIWFWAPLVAKWYAKPNLNAKAAPAATTAATASPPPTALAAQPVASATATPRPTVKSKLLSQSWRQIVSWIEHDPRTAPASDLGSGRDPFSPVRIAEANSKQQKHSVETHELTPADAGLALNSTIVGVGQSVALIGGEVYKEGSSVAAKVGEGGFRIVEIRPREVILERNGKLYRLNLPTNEWAAGGDAKSPSDFPLKDNNPNRPHGKLHN